ncbi:hypothetical protein [Snodgrassella communis]|uniref:hypothetical protein n=1 Tax=Snodgrassella communis TaxID=2946699 RepID=UPI001EF41474|nr:hypothetical protein [Snodgrassella communis]
MEKFIKILDEKGIKYTVVNDAISVHQNLNFFQTHLKYLPANLTVYGDLSLSDIKIKAG